MPGVCLSAHSSSGHISFDFIERFIDNLFHPFGLVHHCSPQWHQCPGIPNLSKGPCSFCLTLQSSSLRARMSGSTARSSPILPNDSAAFHLLDGSSSSSMAIKCPSRSSSSVIILWSSSHPVFQILLARGGELSTPPRTPQSYKSRVQQESRTLMIRA